MSRLTVYIHDTIGPKFHVGVNKHTQTICLPPKYIICAASNNDTGTFFSQFGYNAELNLPKKICVVWTGRVVGEGGCKKSPGGVLSGFFDVIFIEPAFFCNFLQKFTVVAGDSQFLCYPLSDGSSSAAELPADGDDPVFHVQLPPSGEWLYIYSEHSAQCRFFR